MPKNILVLSTSPRRQGNSDQLADAFIRGAQDAGHRTEKLHCVKKILPSAKAAWPVKRQGAAS